MIEVIHVRAHTLTGGEASKKSRPLSANKKKSSPAMLDSTLESRAVIEAMQRENEELARRRTPTPRQSHSAPARRDSSATTGLEPQAVNRSLF